MQKIISPSPSDSGSSGGQPRRVGLRALLGVDDRTMGVHGTQPNIPRGHQAGLSGHRHGRVVDDSVSGRTTLLLLMC